MGRPRQGITNHAAPLWLKLTTTRWTLSEATTCYRRRQRREVEAWRTCRAEMAHSRFKWVHWPLTRRSSRVLPHWMSHQTTGRQRIHSWWNRRPQAIWRLTRHPGKVRRAWPSTCKNHLHASLKHQNITSKIPWTSITAQKTIRRKMLQKDQLLAMPICRLHKV